MVVGLRGSQGVTSLVILGKGLLTQYFLWSHLADHLPSIWTFRILHEPCASKNLEIVNLNEYILAVQAFRCYLRCLFCSYLSGYTYMYIWGYRAVLVRSGDFLLPTLGPARTVDPISSLRFSTLSLYLYTGWHRKARHFCPWLKVTSAPHPATQVPR